MKYVDVTNDIAFRKIFGNENKKISLISFLNAVINFPVGNKVVDVEILNPYQLSKLSGGKSTIVDVKAKDKIGNTFIVEMQIAEHDFFHKRILYYTSQSYLGQIDVGKNFNKLNPAYFIGILEFEIGNDPNYISCHKVLDVETNEQIIQDMEFNFIELPKFNKEIKELTTSIDQWTYFIKNAENLNVIPENIQDEGLKEAYLEADKHNWTRNELDDYERASIKEGEEINRLAFAERKAEARGEARGEAIGEARGEILGEIKSKKEIARKLKKKGIEVELIMEMTDFTKAEIEGL